MGPNVKKPLGRPEPFNTPPPKVEEDLYPETEVSAVTDAPSLYRKIERVDRMLRRMATPISQIPDIQRKVNAIGERVTRTEEQIISVKERVLGVEGVSSRPHDCFQVGTIDRLEVASLSLRKGVEDDTRKLALVEAEVDTIQENAKDVRSIRRANRAMWIGTGVSLLVVVFTSVWYMRGVSDDIALEAQVRDLQFKQVQVSLSKVSKHDDVTAVSEQIERLQTTTEKNGKAKLIEWCTGRSEEELRRVKSVLPRDSWPDCDFGSD